MFLRKLPDLNIPRLIIASFLFSSLLFFISVYTIKFQDFRFLKNNLPLFAILLLLPLQELVFRVILRKIFGFFPSALIFAAIIPSIYYTSYENYLVLALFYLATGLILNFLAEKEGVAANILGQLLLFTYYSSTLASIFFPTAVLSIFLISFSLYWYCFKGLKLPESMGKLGLTKENLLRDMFLGILTTFLTFILASVTAISLSFLGVHDAELVRAKVQTFPFAILVFAVVIAPISEEIFFRGFLMPRIGILFSSLAFAFAHTQYGSISEIAAALVIGAVLAYSFKYTKSLTTPIVAHSLFNLISITLMRLIG